MSSNKEYIKIIVSEYYHAKGIANMPRWYYQKEKISYGRDAKDAKLLLEDLAVGSSYEKAVDQIVPVIWEMASKAKEGNMGWNLGTIRKWMHENKI